MAQTEMMTWFKAIIVVMLFYSVSITLITYALPAESKHYVDPFSDVASEINLENTSAQLRSSVEAQTNIPVIELGALVFYSGNILVDLLLNFAFAIPEMIGLVINGVMLLLNIDSYIFAIVEIFAAVMVTVLYFIGLIQLLTSVRSGRMV